jgi:hypothetical protein
MGSKMKVISTAWCLVWYACYIAVVVWAKQQRAKLDPKRLEKLRKTTDDLLRADLATQQSANKEESGRKLVRCVVKAFCDQLNARGRSIQLIVGVRGVTPATMRRQVANSHLGKYLSDLAEQDI